MIWDASCSLWRLCNAWCFHQYFTWTRWRLESPFHNLFNSFFGITTKKCSKLCILGFCEGNPLEIGTFPWLRARYMEDMPMSWCHFAADALNDVSKHFHNINTINRTTPIQLTIPHFLSAKNKKWKWSFWYLKIYHCVTFCSNFYVRSHIKHKEHWLGKCRIWTNS